MSRRFEYRLVTIIIVVAFISISIITAGAQQGGTGTSNTTQSYGAIAYGEGGGRYSSGYASNYLTQADADARAVEECGRSPCEVVMRFWGKYCGVVTRGNNGAWGSSSAATVEEAREIAEKKCRDYGGRGCVVLASACNSQ